MKFRLPFVCLFVLSFFNFAWSASTQQIQLPLLFERNVGQENQAVQYFVRGSAYKTLLSRDQAQFIFRNEDGSRSKLAISLEASQFNRNIEHVGAVQSRVNYYEGDDQSKWRTGVPAFSAAIYNDVYKGIDWLFYESNGLVEFDFVVSPGKDASQISMDLNGADQVAIDAFGNLEIFIGSNRFSLHAPISYQCNEYQQHECKGRSEIKAKYKIAANHKVQFELGPYEENKTLIIDPKIGFGTMLGGNTFDNASDVAVDTKGNFYVVGYTEAFNRIPGNGDGFVHKFGPTGALIWSTFLVGSSGEDARSIAVNPAGITFVGGTTTSRDFPIVGPFQSTFGGVADGYLVKLAPNGTIMRSSFIGGSGRDAVNHVQLGTGAKLGRGVYLFGNTDSRNFPRKNAAQNSYGGGTQDAFLSIVHAVNFQQLMSTYVGNNQKDESGSLGINPVRGDLYALNINGPNSYIAQFKPVGSGPAPLVNYSISRVPLNSAGLNPTDPNEESVPIILMTAFANLGPFRPASVSAAAPGIGIAYDRCLQATPGAACNGSGSVQFMNQDLVTQKIVNFGAIGAGIFINDAISGKDGSIYVVGDTTSNNLPQVNSFQPTRKGGWEAFVIKLAPVSQETTLSSYLGGTAFDFASGVAVDKTGNLIVVGQTSSKNFPTSPGAPKRSVTGTADGYVVKITP
jgi:hypothetical protein